MMSKNDINLHTEVAQFKTESQQQGREAHATL